MMGDGASERATGELLRGARQARGLSLRDLGARLGLSQGYVCDVENGRRRVTPRLCERLSELLGLCRVELFASAGLLPEGVRRFLGTVPAALGLLEEARELDLSESDVAELRAEMRRRFSRATPT